MTFTDGVQLLIDGDIAAYAVSVVAVYYGQFGTPVILISGFEIYAI